MSDLSAAVAAVEADYAQTLTERLRENAVENGWPVEVAASLTVEAENGLITVRHNDDPAVIAWEYGDGSRPAIPVIRRWINRAVAEWDAEYWEKVSSTVWKWAIDE